MPSDDEIENRCNNEVDRPSSRTHNFEYSCGATFRGEMLSQFCHGPCKRGRELRGARGRSYLKHPPTAVGGIVAADRSCGRLHLNDPPTAVGGIMAAEGWAGRTRHRVEFLDRVESKL